MLVLNSTRRCGLVLTIALQFGQFVFAQDGSGDSHWVATWASAQQQPGFGRGGPGGRAPAAPPAAAQAGPQAGAQPAAQSATQTPSPAAAAPQAATPASTLNNQTARMIV